jgi:hypothetical protein
MTSRSALRPHGRSLWRRLEALEHRRAQSLSALPAYKVANFRLLPTELLHKVELVCEWLIDHEVEALTDEHQLVLKEVAEFYKSLESQGVDIYDSAGKAAA